MSYDIINGKSNDMQCVTGEHYRITVLASRMLRLEYCESNIFEDRPSVFACCRNFDAPKFEVCRHNGKLEIHTEYLSLFYDEKPFSAGGLSIKVRSETRGIYSTWHYGDKLRENLGGTARTLDMADGEIPLRKGIQSRLQGYSVIDDSDSPLIESDGSIMSRAEKAIDLYFFGYGLEYQAALNDFFELSGRPPMLPRYALGNWWSRFHAYSDDEYLNLMDRFRAERVPFSVAVMDMDWHITDITAKQGKGWTGYTWNKELFRDPKNFLSQLHSRGLKCALNLHPAEGIQPHEEQYVEATVRMGLDPASGRDIPFDMCSKDFVDTYFKCLLKPREDEGVDFWWIDWQQGTNTAIPGLDPLWMLNHYHTIHSQKKDGKGLIFSRYAGPGSHRYPVGFSGDTVITWESLDFQPYFTATASNIGYGWWSHDIGGHMMGYKNDELALRWLQLGVFSPIMRLHSTCCEFNGKEPWRYRKEVELIMDKFLRLRHQMIPYLHTMNRRASEEGIPLIQPLYYQNPGKWDAFRMKNEYYFGSDILVNPITQPISTATRMGKVMALLPEGTWIDLFTGTVYNGDRKIELYRSLDSIPVLAKAGAIVTLDARTTGNAIDNPEILKVIVAAGADGSFRLDEEATDNVWCSTTFTYKWGDEAVLTITPEKTKKEGMPAERAYELVFAGTAQGMTAQKKKADGTYETLETSYDSDKQCTTVILPMQDIESEITVVTYNTALADNHQVERIFELLNRAEIEFSLKDQIYAIAQKKGSRNDAYLLDQLTLLNAPEDVFGAVKEILTALD